MPRKGTAYPIDDEWRRRVEQRMAELAIPSRAELARRVKCSRAAITELFDEEQRQSTLVPDVHKALGWPPPSPLFLAQDAQELLALYNELSDFDRGEHIGGLRAKVAQKRAEAAAAASAKKTKK